MVDGWYPWGWISCQWYPKWWYLQGIVIAFLRGIGAPTRTREIEHRPATSWEN